VISTNRGPLPDTGHTLLWQHPADYPMASVEYKVLPSGAHAAAEDYLYVHGIGTPDLLLDLRVVSRLFGESAPQICWLSG
jgi:hypothetical protein